MLDILWLQFWHIEILEKFYLQLLRFDDVRFVLDCRSEVVDDGCGRVSGVKKEIVMLT